MPHLTLKCTKIDFGWGSAPDLARGANSAHPDPLAGFKGPTSKGGEGSGREGREGRGGRGARPVCLLILTMLATGLAADTDNDSDVVSLYHCVRVAGT